MKKHLSLILVLLPVLFLALPALAQERKKVGVVLSGGGAKGVAHIQALKVIEEAGIPIDYIVGTSMGSIIGGLYSIGYTPQQLHTPPPTHDSTSSPAIGQHGAQTGLDVLTERPGET